MARSRQAKLRDELVSELLNLNFTKIESLRLSWYMIAETRHDYTYKLRGE